MEGAIAAVVLAGGQSSRMGQDKARVTVQGKPMLQRVCEAAQHCAQSVIVVSPWVAQYHSMMPVGCIALVEQVQGKPQGPLVAFVQAIATVEAEWVLLLACDLPNLDGEVLSQWADMLAQIPTDAIAYLPRSHQGWEPLCGFYHQRCRPSLQQFVDNGGRSFQRWLVSQTVQPIPAVPAQLLFNCNTPEDLQNV